MGSVTTLSEADVTNCYAAGEVAKTQNFGAFGSSTNIFGCYFLDSIANATVDGSLVADNSIKKLTDAQMQDKASFAGFDFESVWEMGSGDYKYPVFKAKYEQAAID